MHSKHSKQLVKCDETQNRPHALCAAWLLRFVSQLILGKGELSIKSLVHVRQRSTLNVLTPFVSLSYFSSSAFEKAMELYNSVLESVQH